MNMYTIYDATVGKFYGRIFLFLNDDHAMRVFGEGVTNNDDPMSKNPDDYAIYRIGQYDDDTGIPEGIQPVRIQTGIEAVKARQAKIFKTQALQDEIARINGIDTGDELDAN